MDRKKGFGGLVWGFKFSYSILAFVCDYEQHCRTIQQVLDEEVLKKKIFRRNVSEYVVELFRIMENVNLVVEEKDQLI